MTHTHHETMTTSTHLITSTSITEISSSSAGKDISIEDEEGEPEPTPNSDQHLRQPKHAPHDSEDQVHDERILINHLSQIFQTYAPQKDLIDYRDDCASLSAHQFLNSSELIFTTDAICEGVHFDLQWDQYGEIGAQAAVVNLSDLASCGARPKALLWSLSIPHQLSQLSVRKIAEGFGQSAGVWSCPVIGGNICVRPGPLEIHVTAIGSVKTQALTRMGAQPGDAVYVTGTLGDRALGYLDPSHQTRALRHQWRPHLEEAYALAQWGHVHAMLDISDGLLIDLERLAQVNELCINIRRDALPLSDFVRSHPLGRQAALSGGEDYVLLFTAPPHVTPPDKAQATLIGNCQMKRDRTCLTMDDIPCEGQGHLYHLTSLDSGTE